jgi:Flp pilus assembly pilin Flp
MRQRGVDVIEYGLILATIAVTVLLVVALWGATISRWFEELAGVITR